MATTQDQIKAALMGLDPKDDSIWTTSGQPIVDHMKKLLSDEQLTRQDITNALPTFTRQALLDAQQPPAPTTDPVEKTGDGVDVQALVEQRAAAHAELDAQVKEASDEIAFLKRQADDAALKLAKATAAKDALLEAAAKLSEPAHVTNTKAIQEFVAAQARERAAKAGVALELRKVGITPALMQVGSKLDQAMARNRNRGTSRPSFIGAR